MNNDSFIFNKAVVIMHLKKEVEMLRIKSTFQD